MKKYVILYFGADLDLIIFIRINGICNRGSKENEEAPTITGASEEESTTCPATLPTVTKKIKLTFLSAIYYSK